MKTTAFKIIKIGAVIATALVLGACTKSKNNANETSDVRAPVANTHVNVAEVRSPLASEEQETIRHMLAAYEQIRANLASDDIAAVGEDAATLQKSATDAATGAPSELRTILADIAGAAGRLKEMGKTDADAVRKTFGEVSRPVVALLSKEPSLQVGKHIFECPMAQGYWRWVQASARISNPYMGTRMLECGRASKWDE